MASKELIERTTHNEPLAMSQDRVLISVKGLNKDTEYALKRSYSPLFYDLMLALDARRYKKATPKNPALLGDVRMDLLMACNPGAIGIKFEIADLKYDPWSK